MAVTESKTSRLSEFLIKPEKGLWQLALPVMAGMGIQTLYTIVDMIFIGRLGGEAIAAVAFNMPFFFFVLGLTIGLGSGVTASIARFVGAKDKVNVDNCAEHAIIIGLIIAAFLTTAGLFYGKGLLDSMGAKNEVLDISWSYLQIICFGLPFMVFSAFFRSILLGEGDTKLPTSVAALGTVLNIVLDPIFIFTFGLGVAGAAWATVLSQSVVFIIFVYMLFVKEHSYIRFKLKDFSFSTYIINDIIKVGLPASMSMVIMSFGQLVFNRILAHFSDDAVAAFQIGGRIEMVIFLPILSISYALTTLVGMFFGAQELDKLKQVILYGLKSSFVIALITSTVVFTNAPLFVKAFTDIGYIQDTATTYLRLLSLVYPLVAIALPSGRILQGFGLGMPLLVITLIRVLLISSPLALVFVFVQHRPLEWIWYSMMISTIVAVVVAVSWLIWAIKKFSVKTIGVQHEKTFTPTDQPIIE